MIAAVALTQEMPLRTAIPDDFPILSGLVVVPVTPGTPETGDVRARIVRLPPGLG